jgi:hypothetical protein
MNDRLEGAGQVCLNIIPLLWNLILSKKNFELLHNLLLSYFGMNASKFQFQIAIIGSVVKRHLLPIAS